MVYNVGEAKISDLTQSIQLITKICFYLNYVEKKNEDFFSCKRIKEVFVDYITDKECAFFICQNENEDIVGLLLCYLYQPFVSKKEYKRSQDLLIQPDPILSQRERSKVFLLLLDQYESWAKNNNVKDMFLGINVKNDIRKSMRRKGFMDADYLLKKEL